MIHKRTQKKTDPPKIRQTYQLGRTKNEKLLIGVKPRQKGPFRPEPVLANQMIKPSVSKSRGINSSRFSGNNSIFGGNRKTKKGRRKNKSKTRKTK